MIAAKETAAVARPLSHFQQTATPFGSVERLQLEARMVGSPGLEVEIELAAPLALGRCVGDGDLDRAIDDLVSSAAQRCKK